jgi:dihydroorotase
VLEAVDAGRLSLATAIAALTTGPARVLGAGGGAGAAGGARPRGLTEGESANLVVFDRSERWSVTPRSLVSKGKNSPLLGCDLPGRVLLTVASGRLAYTQAG